MKPIFVFLLLLPVAGSARGADEAAAPGSGRADRPNILWITSEDNSPYLGFQVKNLIDDPQYAEVVGRMRKTLRAEMVKSRDTGLVPEGMCSALAGKGTMYELAQGGGFDPAGVLDVAATAFLVAGDAGPAAGDLAALLADPVLDVRTVAAEALGRAGKKDAAIPVLLDVIKTGNEHEALAAITALENFARGGIVPMADALAMLPKKVPGDCERVVGAMKTIP
ncbi:MAG: hypothetical protein HKN82_15960 [Akkermansiaceae bacterium]|nr:hypothetical protein [Akkermansiaceae bacterium]NNM29945.1 hypothetical protein [Akkermansiaceae bacterium]